MHAPGKTLLATLVLAGAAAGCGPLGSGDADPAELAPTGAPLLVEAAIDPSGEQETGLRALMAKFPGGEAAADGTLLQGAVEQALEGLGAPISFAEDVEPWLGDNAGLWVTGVRSSGDPEVALALSTDDANQARIAIEQAFEGGREVSYEGVDYLIGSRGGEQVAAGIVDDFAVVATPVAFTASIDASKGESLAETEAYESAVGELESERLATFYVDPRRIIELGGEAGGFGDAAEQAAAGSGPVAGSVVTDADGVTVDTTTTVPAGTTALAAGAGEVLDQLPAASVLALGIPDLGPTLRQAIEQAATGAGSDAQTLGSLLRGQTGVDALAALDWLGDVGLFLAGDSLADLEAGAVIETTDPEASARTIDQLRGFLEGSRGVSISGGSDASFALEAKGLSEPLVVEQRDSRIVVGFGRAGVDAGFDPEQQLGQDDAYRAAVASLGAGYDPTLYLAADELLALVAGALEAKREPGFEGAQAYLEPLANVISGGRIDGDRVWSRLRLNVD